MDQVVVITGASSGIGASLARLLASKGARVVLAARREKELKDVAAQCGKDALPVVTDVTRRADVEALMKAAVAKFGHVDVWVNNAGRGISRMVSQLTDDDLDEMWRVNVKSALYGMQVAAAHFKERGKGQIINVSSMLGRVPFAPQRSAYNAAKHALNALSANLRMELRQSHPGIMVTTFLPGVVATDFGLNALGGGIDNRKLPDAQDVDEVAGVMLDAIVNPRADVYSRPAYRQRAAAYYAAEDMGALEASFGPPPQKPA